MKFFFVGLAFCLLVNTSAAQVDPAIEAKVSSLLNKMSLEEKVGQMTQVTIGGLLKRENGRLVLDVEKAADAIENYKVGSFLNSIDGEAPREEYYKLIGQLQEIALRQKNKIPIIYGLDNVHGAGFIENATLFPQQIGMAASWNRELVKQCGVITAYEARAANNPWTFSPVLDLGTNPVWPRIWEGFGEDPYLVGELGVAYVKGAQEPLNSNEKVATCLKHYLVYSDPKSGKDRTDAWIAEHYLREYHLAPFAKSVKAGARTVMINSGLINGIPTHINKHLLTDILKKELSFTGFVVTDWQDIEKLYRRDKVAKDLKGAIELTINAGIDMSMTPDDYKGFATNLVALVKENKVSIERINDAVKRILRVKFELGLFETPNTRPSDYPNFGSKDFAKYSYDMTAESVTLLKNENNVLPIKTGSKILVTGPNANSIRALNGGWTYTHQGNDADRYAKGRYHTIYKALQKEFGADNVLFEEGVAYKEPGKWDEERVVDIDKASKAAAGVDYIVLCLGENTYTEVIGNVFDLNLSANLIKLAEAMIATGKPVILILNEGRPRIISKIEPKIQAILQAYLPGYYGGDIVAKILKGDINPSGKLPYTYPKYANDLEPYYHKNASDYVEAPSANSQVQYAFGHGLSYTTFNYENLVTDKREYNKNDVIKVKMSVKNTGRMDGKETIQVYISDLLSPTLAPDVKRLRAFEKIFLNAGETKFVELKIPVKDLAVIGTDNKPLLEAGGFKIQVANQSKIIHVK